MEENEDIAGPEYYPMLRVVVKGEVRAPFSGSGFRFRFPVPVPVPVTSACTLLPVEGISDQFN